MINLGVFVLVLKRISYLWDIIEFMEDDDIEGVHKEYNRIGVWAAVIRGIRILTNEWEIKGYEDSSNHYLGDDLRKRIGKGIKHIPQNYPRNF